MSLGIYEDEVAMFYSDTPQDEINRLKQKIATLEDQHQQDCVRINDLTTTIHVLSGLYTQLRKHCGMD